jgi:hypothetical protein
VMTAVMTDELCGTGADLGADGTVRL